MFWAFQKGAFSLNSKLSFFFFLICLQSFPVESRDLGTQGHTYVIKEPDLLEVLTCKLKTLEHNGSLEHHNQVFLKKTQKTLERPKPVPNIQKCTKSRVRFYDPSFTVSQDLKDQKGNVFQRAGTRINPLSFQNLIAPLLFIDGDDDSQVNWASSVHQQKSGTKIILVSGSPFDLMKQFKTPIYFDQNGRLTQKFGIDFVPAMVSQEGLQLKIEEVDLSAPTETHMGEAS